MIKIYTDANPKKAVFIARDEFLQGFGEVEVEGTVNENEYRAIISALDWMIANDIKEAEILSDSQLVIKQILGEYSVTEERLRSLLREVLGRITKGNLKVKFTWIPREENPAGKYLGD